MARQPAKGGWVDKERGSMARVVGTAYFGEIVHEFEVSYGPDATTKTFEEAISQVRGCLDAAKASGKVPGAIYHYMNEGMRVVCRKVVR